MICVHVEVCVPANIGACIHAPDHVQVHESAHAREEVGRDLGDCEFCICLSLPKNMRY